MVNYLYCMSMFYHAGLWVKSNNMHACAMDAALINVGSPMIWTHALF